MGIATILILCSAMDDHFLLYVITAIFLILNPVPSSRVRLECMAEYMRGSRILETRLSVPLLEADVCLSLKPLITMLFLVRKFPQLGQMGKRYQWIGHLPSTIDNHVHIY